MLLFAGAAQLSAQVLTAVTANILSFSHQQNSLTAPQPQTVRVLSSPSGQAFTATATTNNGGSWLLVNGSLSTGGTTGAVGQQDIQVAVQTLGLPPGNYSGTIVVNVTGATPNTIQVFLLVSAQPQVVASPSAVFLDAQAGTSASQPLLLASTGAATTWTAAVERLSPNFPVWLSVTPTTGTTGTSVTITANTAGLTSGVAVGSVVFTSASGGAVTVPVQLTIAGGGPSTLIVNPETTNIGFQLGTQTPPSRSITVTTSSSATVQYTAQVTAGAWLSLSPFATSFPTNTTVLTGTTPNPFHVVANPAGLVAGTYEGRVLVTSPGITGSKEVVVRLVVSTQPLLQSLPESLTFNQTLGGTLPAAQTVSITTSSGVPLQFQAAATTTSASNWLVVSPSFGITNQTPLTVSLNPTVVATLGAGTHSGTITVSAAGAATQLTIPVTLTISGSTLINVNPAQLTFQTQQGVTPAAQSFLVTSTDGSNQTVSITTEYSGTTATGWLVISPLFATTGSTGALVNVNVNPLNIPPGSHSATIVVTPQAVQNAIPARIPVTLTVTGSATVTASPTSLQFNQVGTTVPANQTVTLTSSLSGLNFFAAANQPWITVTPASGILSATGTPITVGVNPTGLTQGQNYEGAVTVSVSGVTTLTIPVRFSYQSSGALTLAPASLTFNAQTGGTAPAAQNIAVTSTGVALPFTAAATTTTGGNWLSVSPASGNTTASGGAATNLSVSVNATGLAAGTYQGTITVTSANASNSPQTATVTLVVTQPAAPVITSISNAATNQPTAAAPGLIMAIKGSNLGPATGVGAQIQGGVVTTQIGDVRVLFDNVPAPVLFARQDQVNTIAPYFVATRTSTRVVLEYRGVRSDPIDLRVSETAPGIFTIDATGNGQGAVLNQDNSVNGPSNPAARGSIIVIYATGEGQVIPAGTDGQVITATNLRRPFANVTVRIGGQNAEVLYAGSAPGLVSGALQVNARVPANLTIAGTANVPVELIIGNGNSATAQNVSVSIRQ
jgi:uncharacterized protein (TIGR03437 family)